MEVHLFANTGLGLEDDPVSLRDFLDFHAPFAANIQSTNHKLFARGKLGLSKTIPTVTLRQDQFRVVDDIRSRDGKVMTDGCALMSASLGVAIHRCLNLAEVPSAYQGRIGGAKGVWLVDKRSSSATGLDDRDFWIEIRPSQLKILPHPVERECSDEIRTFEVSDWAKTLHPTALNNQLITVLHNGGVKRDTLGARLTTLTNDYFDELRESLEKNDPLLTRVWLQKHHSGKGQRPDFHFIGGRPLARIDQIKTYLDVGFSLREHNLLHELVSETFKSYLNDFVEKPRIELPQSTFAFMVPDFWGILQEGEVQLCLGRGWVEPETGIESAAVADVDGLVARNPANHPSDVQRVRFVHKPELAGYSNVIFFPTTGDRPLADLLSGGDYDGDQAFVCWDREIVESFQNFDLGPPDYISTDEVGIVKCSTNLKEVFEGGITEDSVRAYMKSCLEFSLRPSYLGIVTNTHVQYVYDRSLKGFQAGHHALQSHDAIRLAALAAFLVDALKQGYRLPTAHWQAVRKSICGSMQLKEPNYLKRDACVPENVPCYNILDHLRFKVAQKQWDALMQKWWDLQQSLSFRMDEHLLKPSRPFERRVDEERKSTGDQVCRQILDELRDALDEIHKA